MWYVRHELPLEGNRPAVICATGTHMWYVRDKLHQEGDQPAILCANGDQEWSVNGDRRPAYSYTKLSPTMECKLNGANIASSFFGPQPRFGRVWQRGGAD
jgi:hypothetical protein